ncbi:uncharacterized protein LOC124953087 [Vespa velutina]|uniref:uncharacterized protein LOC124953087 n=1 Tax=Vespa velutina TaxID=202808 RepID=UPI001FB40103|nr:uncharacterized protein LOC124953087 [Vespa velutina]
MELPKLARQAKDSMTRFSTILYKLNDFILTIYKAKPNKKALIISSVYSYVEIEKSDTRIPETIRFYNSTKFGVDVTIQMARKYYIKFKYQRWPLQVFFNILHLGGIYACILYKETMGKEISRQEFLFQLTEEFGTEYQKERHLSKEYSSETITNTVINMLYRYEISSWTESWLNKIL